MLAYATFPTLRVSSAQASPVTISLSTAITLQRSFRTSPRSWVASIWLTSGAIISSPTPTRPQSIWQSCTSPVISEPAASAPPSLKRFASAVRPLTSYRYSMEAHDGSSNIAPSATILTHWTRWAFSDRTSPTRCLRRRPTWPWRSIAIKTLNTRLTSCVSALAAAKRDQCCSLTRALCMLFSGGRYRRNNAAHWWSKSNSVWQTDWRGWQFIF